MKHTLLKAVSVFVENAPNQWQLHGPATPEHFNGDAIAHVDNEANAARLALAWNMHDTMIEALRECITNDGANCLAYGADTPTLRRRLASISNTARAALAKVGGGQ